MDTSETYIKMCEKAEEIQGQQPFRDDYYCELREGIVYSYNNVMYVSGEKCIWLPRQDQLQEMLEFAVGKFNDNFWTALADLYEYSFGSATAFMDFIPLTMEQLWLAFVMKEKYNKTWNGEKWTM